ncbi:unnamed protein product [Prorocentrum cordatum]|uniref:CSD domain-containing protein n=1 Tax=Prorocentrum cordatum TaxID=2364126 RepID=A0ABN9WJL0_9DINO|nr:unnamed protein product [Polarella glacialis]
MDRPRAKSVDAQRFEPRGGELVVLQQVPKSCLTPLDKLIADFQGRVGIVRRACADTRRTTAACGEGEWELPSDEGSDAEDGAVRRWSARLALPPVDDLQDGAARRRSARLALRPLGDLQRDFCSRTPVVAAGSAAGAGPRSSAPQAGAARTGALVKVVQHKGFGFILPDGAQVADVLLHCSQLARDGFRDMHVGMRVRYVEETDVRTGKRRAKTAAVIEQEGPRGATTGVALGDAAGASYSRDELLRAFARIGRSSTGSSRCMFSVIRVPQARSSESDSCSSSSSGSAGEHQWSSGDYHASFDDEYLIGKLEERLSKESGFDDMNEETFGESSGWSFEEAVAANAKLAATLPFGLGAAALATAQEAEKHWVSTLASSTTGSGSSAAGCSPGGSRDESPAGSPALRAARGEEAVPLYVIAGLQLQ